jgi:hypothetical protein
MILNQFLNIVDLVLSERGYPISIHDLPDQNFSEYFVSDMDENLARQAAGNLVDDMIDNGDLPDFDDLASIDFDYM